MIETTTHIKTEKQLVPALRFKEFEGEWNSLKLIELSTNGFSNGAFNDPKKVGSGYRIINVLDMYIDGPIQVDTLKRVALDEKEYSKNRVEYGDIFFTRSSLVKEGIAFSNVNLTKEDDLTFDGHLIRMRPNKEECLPKYLYYTFKTSGSRKQFIVRGKTATMTTIGQEDIADVKVPFPSLPEQQKIASFLSAVDEKIQQLTKKKALLEQYKKGGLQQLFSGQLRFKDENGNPYPDWEDKFLGDILARTSTGLNPRNNFVLGSGNNNYVTIKNISNGSLDFGSCEKIDDEAMKLIKKRSDLSKNDLIMSSIGNVGEAYLLKEEPLNWNINESVFMLRASDSVMPKYLYYIITNDYSKWYFESNSTGSSFKSIKLGALKLLPVRLPSKQEQQKIATYLSSIDTKIESVKIQITQTQTFKKGLLQQMFV